MSPEIERLAAGRCVPEPLDVTGSLRAEAKTVIRQTPTTALQQNGGAVCGWQSRGVFRRFSAAVSTTRAGRRKPRSDREGRHQRWDRGLAAVAMYRRIASLRYPGFQIRNQCRR